MQFEINKHLNFSQRLQITHAHRPNAILFAFEKSLLVLIYSKLQFKSCDYPCKIAIDIACVFEGLSDTN